VFDLSLPKLLVLAVIALIIFGPSELPQIAAQAGRALRDLRTIAESAKNDLRDGLGPDFADLDIQDLHPKQFIRKHLTGGPNTDQAAQQAPARQSAYRPAGDPRPLPGEAEQVGRGVADRDDGGGRARH
jgi:sec-independent protein translocase protein TatB